MVLVICEKNDAARRIADILSSRRYEIKRLKGSKVPIYVFKRGSETWEIIGLRGHIITVDYPKERWNLEGLKDLITRPPITKVTEWSIAKTLRTIAPHHSMVIIATDYDREGELIGVEALNIIKKVNSNITVKRAKFSTLTPEEVTASFNKLIDVDYRLSASAEARREIDLAWGVVLSRFLSVVSDGNSDVLSAGRVQTPTLAIVVKRDKEIEDFVPEDYYNIIATFSKTDKKFYGKHQEGNIKDKQRAENIYAKVKDAHKGRVLEAKEYNRYESAPPPFDTTTFLAEASRYLHIAANRALEIAERLYINGYISYPRTDNTVYPPSTPLRTIVKRLVPEYGQIAESILSKTTIKATRGRRETRDHPPIHPIYLPDKKALSDKEWMVYDLIARRFLATLSDPCELAIKEAKIDINDEVFLVKGVCILSPGWRQAYYFEKKDEIKLPSLVANEQIDVLQIRLKALKTKPPPRLTQSELLRIMEKYGIGTKSTRADMIQKIITRRYVRGKRLESTSIGRAVINALETYAPIITKPDMTAKLEADMEKIKEGDMTKEEVKRESYEMLSKVIDILLENKEKISAEIGKAIKEDSNIGNCPICGSPMVIRKNRKNNKRFIGCSNFPKCTLTYSLPQNGSIYKTGRVCSKCHAPLVRWYIPGRKRSKLICPNPKCPQNQKYWSERNNNS